jgi:hypothetical protein
MRRGAFVTAMTVLAGSASAVAAPATVTIDPGCPAGQSACLNARPRVVAFRGWLAWSRFDSTTGEFALALRSPAGTMSTAAAAESPVPFDVNLGPSARGVLAVYSRCTDPEDDLGCGIDELALSGPTAHETAVAIPGGGLDHEPAIWNGELVFLRRDNRASENTTRAGVDPDELESWTIGAHSVHAVRWPTRTAVGVIAGLTISGAQIAYVDYGPFPPPGGGGTPGALRSTCSGSAARRGSSISTSTASAASARPSCSRRRSSG